MDNGSSDFKHTIRLVMIVWGAACLGAAFFIPRFDFGFDGVKVWFYICLMMLVILLGGRWVFLALQRR